MARSYNFSLVQLGTTDARGERLNVGLVIFLPDGLDVRVSPRLDKVRALSGAIDREHLRQAVVSLSHIDRELLRAGMTVADDRIKALSTSGVMTLSPPGEFRSHSPEDYEARIASLMRTLVEPEPATRKLRLKRSRLLTQLKHDLKVERVLAVKGEDIQSHRLVPNLQIDNGLVADLALKNGAMHVIETVDATGGEESFRKAVADIGVAALVFETARIKYGDNTQTKLVYSASPELERSAEPSLIAAEHQGAELINWQSDEQRAGLVERLANLAVPLPRKRGVRFKRVGMADTGLF